MSLEVYFNEGEMPFEIKERTRQVKTYLSERTAAKFVEVIELAFKSREISIVTPTEGTNEYCLELRQRNLLKRILISKSKLATIAGYSSLKEKNGQRTVNSGCLSVACLPARLIASKKIQSEENMPVAITIGDAAYLLAAEGNYFI